MSIDVEALFKKHSEAEFLEDDRIQTPLMSHRRDLCALFFLDRLVPAEGPGKLIHAARHDVFYLDVDMEKFAQVATEDDVIFLLRLGVGYDNEYNCLQMFA